MWLLCICYLHISTPNSVSVSISVPTYMFRSGEQENEYISDKIWCGHILTFPQPGVQCTRHQGCEDEPHIILTQFRS